MSIYTEEFKFYVYAYLRKSDNTPYYIGKGSGKRAWNKHRNNITPKEKDRIIILYKNLSENISLEIEKFLISWYGRKDLKTGILVNLTDGGEGTSGFKPSKEQVDKNSRNYILMNPEGNLFKITNLNRFCKENKFHQGTMAKVAIVGSSIKHYKKWQCRFADDFFDFYSYDELIDLQARKIFTVYSPDGNKYTVKNLSKFCRYYNLNVSHLCSVAHGTRKHTKGWKCCHFNDPTNEDSLNTNL